MPEVLSLIYVLVASGKTRHGLLWKSHISQMTVSVAEVAVSFIMHVESHASSATNLLGEVSDVATRELAQCCEADEATRDGGSAFVSEMLSGLLMQSENCL